MYFPHKKPRRHQEQLISDAYNCFTKKNHLLAHAPTGIGKTAASLSPAVTYALEENKTVFFATPKISQHKIAVSEAQRLAENNGLSFMGVDVVGRKYSCPDPVLESTDHSSFYETCKRRRKDESCLYYNNARGNTKKQKSTASLALEKIIDSYGVIKTNEELLQDCGSLKYGGKPFPLCGYEVALQLASRSTLVICDYFHVLHPHISPGFFKTVGKKPEESIVIIDEAQNVASRVRSALSKSLTNFTLKRAVKELSLVNPELKKKIASLSREVKKLSSKKSCVLKQTDLPAWEEDEIEELKLAGLEYLEATNRLRSSCLSIHSFLEQWPIESPELLRISDYRGIHHKCLDASVAVNPLIDNMHSVVGMSGTLLPLKMYRDLLGFAEDRTILKQYPSPFPIENRLSVVSDVVTTRYAKRTDDQFKKIAEELNKGVDAVPGNTAVFFPSYKVMREVLFYFNPNKPVFSQKERMSPSESAQLLNNFRNKKHFGAVLCAVAGGSFAEGVDYPGRDLLAVFIVGVPLSEWNLETQALVDYCEYKFGQGWNYGYLYPAMNRAIQAAGRVIRNEKDRGVVVFMDERFKWANYAKCFSGDSNIVLTRDASYCVNDFFNQ